MIDESELMILTLLVEITVVVAMVSKDAIALRILV
ncbi:hypothetical protein N836_02720 [Leptolyngbya sp. Heron Island J]|nr:hypothetical protein N836_02720 [Leptolyngbya sp. Heron Island J]